MTKGILRVGAGFDSLLHIKACQKGSTYDINLAHSYGERKIYVGNAGSFAANAVSGVMDAVSAGILIYTGLVELLARDFLFNPERTRDNKRLTFMIVCVFLGAALMALLGKWA